MMYGPEFEFYFTRSLVFLCACVALGGGVLGGLATWAVMR